MAVPRPRDDGWTIAVPGEPPGALGYAPDPVASVGLTKRTYLRGSWPRRTWKGGGRVPQPAIAPAGQQALARPEAQEDQQARAPGNDRTNTLPAPSPGDLAFRGVAISWSPAMPRMAAAGTDRN